MELQAFLRSLHELYGMPLIEPDSDGCCSLSLDDVDADIFPVGDTGSLLAVSAVAPMPDMQSEGLAEAILAANRDFEDANSAFSLDETADTIYLQTQLTAPDDDAEPMAAGLLSHIALVREWRERIVQYAPAADEQDESVPASIGDGWIPA